MPRLTDAVLQRWAATTVRRSNFLPVHPWLYGLLPDDEGTPLVGIAFRLELDILQHCRESDEDDGDTDRTWERVRKCLTAFPPLNSELHFVPLGEARKWLETIRDEQGLAKAHFDGEEWRDSIATDEPQRKFRTGTPNLHLAISCKRNHSEGRQRRRLTALLGCL